MHDEFYSVELACDLIMIRLCMNVRGVLVCRQAQDISGKKLEYSFPIMQPVCIEMGSYYFSATKTTIIT